MSACRATFPVQLATGITSGNRACRTHGCRRLGRIGVDVDVGVVNAGFTARRNRMLLYAPLSQRTMRVSMKFYVRIQTMR